MLIDSNPSLWVFFIIMAGLLGGPALFILPYLITRTILYLLPVPDEEQQIGMPLETLGKSLREVVDPRNPSRSSPYYVDNYFTGIIHSTLITTIHVTSFPPYRHLGPQR